MQEKELIYYLAKKCYESHANVCGERDNWAIVAMIIQSVFGNTEEGFECFHLFSMGSDGYKSESDCRKKYYAERSGARQYTIATLIYLCQQHGIDVPKNETSASFTQVLPKFYPKQKTQPKQQVYDVIPLQNYWETYCEGVEFTLPFTNVINLKLNSAKYHVATTADGGLVYPFIDQKMMVCNIKKMYYKDGKRDHSRQPIILNKRYNINNTKPCIFGEHLINGMADIIFLVEAEKTAIILDAVLDANNVAVVASGGKERKDIMQHLHNITQQRKVVMVPDIDAVEAWTAIADKYGWSVFDIGAFKHMGDKIDIADIYLSGNSENIATANNMLYAQINDMLN